MSDNSALKYIIIQAGGRGTRMEKLTKNKPKALVPVDNLPMIFHLFRKYPEMKYFVIGDYKYDVLERYMKTFAKVSYEMIDARGKKGTCAGISDAIKLIPDDEPFMITWCDLILPDEYEIPNKKGNYVGISRDFRCRWSFENGNFEQSPSAEHGVAGHFIFENTNMIKDIPGEGEFVRWLSDTGKVFRELPLYHTKEYGLISDMEKLDSGRCRPFNRICILNDRIIKTPIDDQGRSLAVRESAWYERVKDEGFENIPQIYKTEPLEMERIDGKNIFEYSLSGEEKKKILREVVDCIRKIHELEKCETDKDSFYEAYIGKTFDRLWKVRELVPFADKEHVIINGVKCRNVFFCREELENKVMKYLPKSFCFLHGDCTFSNMMLKGESTPVMIDPRGYFGFTELYGDPAYDWAKLYYSIVGNYDQFNLRRFDLEIDDESVSLKIMSNGWEDMEGMFFELLGNEVDPEQIKLLHAIIYLSLTTYAWEDYDSICGAFYKGLLLLEEALGEERL